LAYLRIQAQVVDQLRGADHVHAGDAHQVSDQDKALDFNTNVLGLEKRVENPTRDGPRFLTVGVKGTTSSWFSSPGHRDRPSRRWDAPQRRSRSTPTISGRDFGRVRVDVIELPCGYVAQFRDPGGNRLQEREGR
jgi:hypothetical protein